MGATMERQARRVLAREGATIPRPAFPGSGPSFSLAYVRTGPRTELPTVVLPGGPGLASIVPYRSFRARGARRNLDLIMVEHRGVGMSGRTGDGAALPSGAVTIELAADDVAAVLDEVGARKAVVVGSSYGSYLAQAVAVLHPDRVAALVLDSPMLSVTADLATTRAHRRRLLWEGDCPATVGIATSVNRLAMAGEPMDALSNVVQVTYEFAGPEILERLLRARLEGRLGWLWDRLGHLGAAEIEGPGVPFFMEPGPVSGIAYRQLGYGLPPDGGPLDPQLTFAEAARRQPAYAGEPFDLVAEVPRYPGPTVVVSGDRDLRTPRPIAERIVELARHGVLVPLPASGHSALDTHQLALLHVIHATVKNRTDRLPGLADRLAALPRRGISTVVGNALTLAVRATTRALP